MFIGEFAPSVFFKTCSTTIALTILLIYYQSQIYGHEKPFPNCWISKCAQHYPEFVTFRIATVSGAVLIVLGWLTNHFYIKSICREAVLRIQSYHPEISMVVGIMGGLLLMGSTANIDTGVMNGKWHNFCAAQFFFVTLVALIYNTFILWVIHSKVGKVNVPNLYVKTILAVAILVQLYINFTYSQYDEESGEDVGSVSIFLEWTTTATVLSNYYSIGVDAEHFKFVYELNSSKSNQRMPQEEVD